MTAMEDLIICFQWEIQMRIIDISQEVLSSRVYPGDPCPQLLRISDMNQGDLYNLSSFSMCAHNGTHLDAPSHFIQNGITMDEIILDQVVGLCYVAHHHGIVSCEDAHFILSKAIKSNASKRILIAGEAVVSLEAAEVFASSNVILVGNESQSVGSVESPMHVHKTLLEADIVLLEGLVLKDVAEGVYFLSAAPLNIKGIEGSPCRAYLLDIEKTPEFD